MKTRISRTMGLSTRPIRGIGVFRAAWVASKEVRSPTLYSSDRITRRLPFTFPETVLVLLYFLVLYNILSFCCAAEGVYFEWFAIEQGLYDLLLHCSMYRVLTITHRGSMFSLVLAPLILLVLSSLDLHKRRRYRLSPKRIIVNASITLLLLIVSLGLLSSCYFRNSYEHSHCPNELVQMWQISYYYHNLAPIVPFLASFNLVL